MPAPTTAGSSDGRGFEFRTSGAVPPSPGALVVLREPDGLLVGQVLAHTSAAEHDEVRGHGAILGRLDQESRLVRASGRAFADVALEAATDTVLRALQESTGADLPIGTIRAGSEDLPALLRTQGFNRHTFLCGQSGSGKTYALGVILEQLLLNTTLRMVVLDPNGDFVRLGHTLPDAPTGPAEQIAAAGVRVLRADHEHGSPGEPLRLRFTSMPARAQAAVMRLDPIADRAEYHAFMRLREQIGTQDLLTTLETLLSGDADQHALGQRISNLGLMEWEVWARDQPSASEVVQSGARATVLDLGSCPDLDQAQALGLDLVESLWRDRRDRVPTLVVIDEAHNLCPADPRTPVAAAMTDRLVQIAAEGRKFGLWLLLCSQRPSKIHPQVLSQCDNLALMRMNSPADVDELSRIFGFTPPAMLSAAPTFVQGEVLLAGGFAPVPTFARMGARLTYQGGQDVSVPVPD